MGQHEGLVRYAAKRQQLVDLPFDEAYQAGRYGLWRAIIGYDPEKGTQFSTYAYPAIVRHIWRTVKDEYKRERQEHATRELKLFFQTMEQGMEDIQQALEVRQSLQELTQELDERLRFVIISYYGLDGSRPPLVFREIGEQLGLTRQRIQQMHVEALVRMRQPGYSQELRTLLRRHSQKEYEWADEVAQKWLRRRGGRHGR